VPVESLVKLTQLETALFKLKACYPKNLHGDDSRTLQAIELKLDAGHRLADLIEAAIHINIAAANGEDVPDLETFLLTFGCQKSEPLPTLEALH
jgi:hypothetical protein